MGKFPTILEITAREICSPWISSAMAMAMSIYRTLCVLVLYFPKTFLFFQLLPVEPSKEKETIIQTKRIQRDAISVQILPQGRSKATLKLADETRVSQTSGLKVLKPLIESL